jgi:hypothetical protein
VELIERLAALEDIRQLTYTYGWGIDTADPALVAGVFAADGSYDASGLGLGHYANQAEIRAAFTEILAKLTAGSQHSITNHRIEFADDDHAHGTCYIMGEGIGLEGEYIQAHGAYQDTYLRTPDGWRISFRSYRELMPSRKAAWQDA